MTKCVTILDYLDKILASHTKKINENTNAKFNDTRCSITRLEAEFRATNADLSARMSIMEKQVEKKTHARFLQLENATAQQNTQLKKEIEQISQYNDVFAANVDILMQEKLGSNLFITELSDEFQSKYRVSIY